MPAHPRLNAGPERIVLTDALQPYVFRTAKGTLLVQGHGTFPPGYEPPAFNAFPGIPVTAVSRDGGENWQRFSAVSAPGQDGPTIEGAAHQFPDGTIRLFSWVAHGPDENGLFHGQFWDSRDDLGSLSEPQPFHVDIPKGKAGNDDGGHPYPAVTFHGSVVPLKDGNLVTSVYGWLEGDEASIDYQPMMFKNRCMCLRSSDGGRHWALHGLIAGPEQADTQEGFNESTMVRLTAGPKAGRLICLMRSGCFDGHVYQAHSDDNGQTWATPRPLPLRGVDPAMTQLPDGTLAMSCGRRTRESGAPESGPYVAVSTDGGESWSEPTPLPLEPYAVRRRETTNYTAITAVGERELLVFYDVGFWGHPVRYVASRRVEL